MTTVAWDGELLAVDSVISYQDSICSFTQKLRHVTLRDGKQIIAGLGGHLAQGYAFVDWLENPEKDVPKVDEMESIVVLTKSNKILSIKLYDFSPTGFDIAGPFEIGTGWKWALAAMDHGKNAIQAVEYAITRDVFTGGSINYWSVKTG